MLGPLAQLSSSRPANVRLMPSSPLLTTFFSFSLVSRHQFFLYPSSPLSIITPTTNLIDGETVTNLCPLSELQSMALRWHLARKWESHKLFLYSPVTEGIWREEINIQKRL